MTTNTEPAPAANPTQQRMHLLGHGWSRNGNDRNWSHPVHGSGHSRTAAMRLARDTEPADNPRTQIEIWWITTGRRSWCTEAATGRVLGYIEQAWLPGVDWTAAVAVPDKPGTYEPYATTEGEARNLVERCAAELATASHR